MKRYLQRVGMHRAREETGNPGLGIPGLGRSRYRDSREYVTRLATSIVDENKNEK